MKSEKSQNVNKDRNYVRVSSVRIGTLPNEKIRTPILKSRHSEKRKILTFSVILSEKHLEEQRKEKNLNNYFSKKK